ncbi:MAG TPA: flagellar hook capping FlgD N-terminal domain-containing protein [Hyphomonadaceae bacterium]|nr:flagellar hook capping FlgD N-terminal domain-containing protein [Hyphomonadaceae bacterium]
MTSLISFVPPATTTGSTAADSQTELAGNFDTFLKILTSQIQNQDPLQPMDSTQFTQQLVQFSGVEQQIKVNSQLEQLLSATRSNAGASLSGYLGQQAEINTPNADFTGDPIHWRYTLPSDAAQTTVTVTDSAGKVVYSESGQVAAGEYDFTWNGKGFSGATMPTDQAYTINVVAVDADKNPITPTHSLITSITGVDLTYGEPALTTPDGVFAYADIKRLMRQ